jgi:anti-anti-sigma factor
MSTYTTLRRAARIRSDFAPCSAAARVRGFAGGKAERMLDPRVRVLTLSGELDLQTQRRLRSELSEAAGDRSRELLVDLRGVTFLDSSVVAVLVHTGQQLRRQGRAMACVTSTGPVEQLLDKTGLRGTLHLFATPGEAAAYVVAAREQRPR